MPADHGTLKVLLDGGFRTRQERRTDSRHLAGMNQPVHGHLGEALHLR